MERQQQVNSSVLFSLVSQLSFLFFQVHLWHCSLESPRAGLRCTVHCDGLPGPVLVFPPLRLLLLSGGGPLGGRGGDVCGGGVLALVHCSGLRGPALVIPLPPPRR